MVRRDYWIKNALGTEQANAYAIVQGVQMYADATGVVPISKAVADVNGHCFSYVTPGLYIVNFFGAAGNLLFSLPDQSFF